MWIIAPLLCGLIFGAGLLISGMVQPTKVLAFWTSSARGIRACVVMVAALAVSVPGFMLADRGAQPWFAGQYFRPGKSGSICRWSRAPRCSESGGALSGSARGRRWKASATLSPGSSSSSSRWPQA